MHPWSCGFDFLFEASDFKQLWKSHSQFVTSSRSKIAVIGRVKYLGGLGKHQQGCAVQWIRRVVIMCLSWILILRWSFQISTRFLRVLDVHQLTRLIRASRDKMLPRSLAATRPPTDAPGTRALQGSRRQIHLLTVADQLQYRRKQDYELLLGGREACGTHSLLSLKTTINYYHGSTS